MIKERIKMIQNRMKEYDLNAYIIPSGDPHQSEYVSDYWMERAWASGFTGSMGTLVVTKEQAYLWVDGRYILQARNETESSGISVIESSQGDALPYLDWLKNHLCKGNRVGYNGKVFPLSSGVALRNTLKELDLKYLSHIDLVGELWKDRPSLIINSVFHLPMKFAGKSVSVKMNEVRELMKDQGASSYIISSLDDVAWLFNLRGSDIPHNPVATAYAMVAESEAMLFIHQEKIEPELRSDLENHSVTIKDYNAFSHVVHTLDSDETLYLDPVKTTDWLSNQIPSSVKKIFGSDLVQGLKTKKNPTEILNTSEAYRKDGVALVKFGHWLQETLKNHKVTEVEAAEKIQTFRKEQNDFVGPSFSTIAAFGGNGAMMHYRPDIKNPTYLEKGNFFLLDSGGQYFQGTTDITRTFPVGEITKEMKKEFTLVLKGLINLSTTKFLKGTTGANLDVIARLPLWKEGIDYKCGTGHGIGCFLGVHEGPQRLSPLSTSVALEESMFLTIEPGVYREKKYGIRLENTVVVKKVEENSSGVFYAFETFTYCPFSLDALDPSLLTSNETSWLNSYHEKVYELLSPSLTEAEKEYLKSMTKPIESKGSEPVDRVHIEKQ